MLGGCLAVLSADYDTLRSAFVEPLMLFFFSSHASDKQVDYGDSPADSDLPFYTISPQVLVGCSSSCCI